MAETDTIIAPTILTDNQEVYNQKIAELSEFAERVHIDVADGELTPTPTLSDDKIWWPKEWEVDIHMMAKEPSKHLDSIISLKPSLVILHADIEEDLLPSLSKLKDSGIKAGVAIFEAYFPGDVKEYIEAADHVMIFSGKLGEMGGKASMLQLEKVHMIKAINPDVEIGWDGGANVDNVFNISSSGVDVINVGSALEDAPDPAATYKILVKTANKRGVI